MYQIVCVRWGEAYSPAYVNRLYEAAARWTSVPFHFVCLTDRLDEPVHPAVRLKPFPDFGIPFERLTRGFFPKLSVFHEGVLSHGVPAIYIDLDTMITGDLGRLAARVRARPAAMYMMRNHYVDLWRVSGLLKRVWPTKYFYGNSSLLGFYPERFYWLAERAKDKLQGAPTHFPKELVCDDRFISCTARDHVRVFPARDVVKFAPEYMAVVPAIERIRSRLSWVARRRQNLVAITFEGGGLKPPVLARLNRGDLLRHKHYAVEWQFPEISAYWREVVDSVEDHDPARRWGEEPLADAAG